MKDKVVKYRGRKYTVPDWAEWLAMAGNGEVRAFQQEPQASRVYDAWFSNGKEKVVNLVIEPIWKTEIGDWRGSKVKLKEQARR